MNENRLTFLEPTNISLPISIFDTLVDDAYYFGFKKNNKANLSGFLNHLIPVLAEYRKDLHLSFLNANNGDEELTTKIEENIYKTYFSKYDYCDDGKTIVPFRANKEHLQQFLDIHDNLLNTFNMDFTEFIRSLLIEYCSKRINQREYFFQYKIIPEIKKAIANGFLCHFYARDGKTQFVPISVELFDDSNFVIGFNRDNQQSHIIPLYLISRLVVTEKAYFANDYEIELVYDFLTSYIKTAQKTREL